MGMSPVFVKMGGPDVVWTLAKSLGLSAPTKVGFTSIDAVICLESALEVLKSS